MTFDSSWEKSGYFRVSEVIVDKYIPLRDMLFNGSGVCFWCSGLLPKALKEWRLLLELLLSREHHGEESPHVCVPMASPDWSPDLTWNNVIKLMLERLGAGHTVNLLQSLTLDTPQLTRDLRYACLLGAVVERRQR